MKLSVAAVVLLVAPTACSRQSAMYPRVSGEYFGEDFLLVQKTVLLVHVTATEVAPGGSTLRKPSGGFLIPMRTKAKVEGILASYEDLPEEIEFYFFTDELGGCRGGRGHDFGPGERWIVFLRQEGERWRTVTDLCSVDFRVYSGRHKVEPKFRFGGTLGEAIAEILLSPGAGHNPMSFARGMDASWSSAAQVAGSRLIISKLRQLVREGPTPVRDAACLVLAQRYSFAGSCLPDAALKVPMPMVAEASGITKVQQENLSRIIATLEERPMDFCKTGKVADVIPEIELMLEHPNPKIQAAARKALRGLQPGKY